MKNDATISPFLSRPRRGPTHAPGRFQSSPFPAARRLGLALAVGAVCGCAALPFTQAPVFTGPTSQPIVGGGPGSGTAGDAAVGTGVAWHYESVLPAGVALLVIVLAMMDKLLMLYDRYASNRRSLARIKAGKDD
jgi:hypothetical protein